MGKQRMSQQKPQLRPWLTAQIDSGRYQGLCWINEERNMFRIPWKHASRHDLSEDDYRIFKDWAIASGKFTEQDANDPPKWKTNFRCALNSNGSFKKVADNSKSSDPHKIYCIVNHNPAMASGVRLGAAETDDELDSILYFSPETEPARPDFNLLPDPNAQEPVENVTPHFGLMSLSDTPQDQLDPGAGHSPNFYVQTADVPGFVHLLQGTAPQEAASQVVTNASSPEQQWEPVLSLSQEGPLHVPAPVSRQPPNQGALSGAEGHLYSQLPSDLDITIYYRGRQVLHTTVTNAVGCRLYFQQESDSFAHLQQIQFPGTDDISDYKQKDFTGRLLRNMEGGLLLWHQAGDLLAKRLGKCQVFWASEDVSTSDESQKLHRDVTTRIFCLKDFIRGIVQFTEYGVRAPPCAIFLCFGQHFAGSEQSKKLILVKVIPKVCESLTEIAHQGGASSLNSENVSLQISNMMSVDSLYALLQEIEHMEVDL